MLKITLVNLLFVSTLAQAAPWNQDCVTWYGASIPVSERTRENCPNSVSHWDQTDTTYRGEYRTSGDVVSVPGYQRSSVNNTLNPSTPQTVVTNSGNYVVVPRYSGGSLPSAVIRSGK